MSMLNRVDKLLGYLDNLKIDFDGIEPLPLNQSSQPSQSSQSSQLESKEPKLGPLPTKIMNALSELKIDVDIEAHQAVTTSEEHAKVISSLDGVLCKNLLVSEKRIKNKCQYLIIVEANKNKIELKVLGKYLGVGGGLRGVSDPDLTFKMSKGSITPLAVLFDEKKKIS
eukprot:707343_1